MSELKLRKMEDGEFANFLENIIPRYAESIAKNVREDNDKALQRSQEQIDGLLPQGNNTPNHYLFHLCDGETAIGDLWIFIDEEQSRAFLYEIFILEEYQGNGYGTKVMQLTEKWLREKNIRQFQLHVFGHNHGARRLYERIGFEIMGISMMKEL
ncbi:GNAT family N-acetyltransferase [Bacillus sp. 165]|uniref:GNAT family N-acetyltransferase n=1 Tax=Bacillus sp. 165 TaxID=1529117 RepID=UPI001ADA0859|nr:GNAT family N-acetyltransferase [Bacillus sp. 165]MBO9130980.1 GNAT family N-acetyltransferase [Bacillus sp. 165]